MKKQFLSGLLTAFISIIDGEKRFLSGLLTENSGFLEVSNKNSNRILTGAKGKPLLGFFPCLLLPFYCPMKKNGGRFSLCPACRIIAYPPGRGHSTFFYSPPIGAALMAGLAGNTPGAACGGAV